MKRDGQMFKRDAAVVYKIGDDIEILIITNIYIINGSTLIFKGKCFELSRYNKHFRAHTLTPLNPHISNTFVFYDHLPLYLPLHPRISRVLPNETIVILPFYLI